MVPKSESELFKILLIEDNQADAILFQKSLESQQVNLDIQVAHDGLAALKELRTQTNFSHNKTDLIVIDLSLPNLDGRQLMFYRQRDPKLNQIPLLVVSGSEHPKDKELAEDMDALAFVAKPADGKDFIDIILKHNLATLQPDGDGQALIRQ